ncbi:MAG: nucleotidyltransferase family protein [Thermosynechococcaceae cyanobacterium]
MQPSSASLKNNSAPEIELLLCCARTHLEHEVLRDIDSLLNQDLDWSAFAQLAAQQGILPLVGKNLQRLKSTVIPEQILNYFKSYSYQVAIQNTVFAKELFKVVEVLQKNKIPVLSFKGPALATSAYGNLGIRQFCDLDILVDPKNFLVSFDTLVSQGYQPTYQWDFLNQDFEISLRGSKSEYTLANEVVCVDLHQHLTVERFLSSKFCFEELWERRQPISICGCQVDGFGDEDTLLYLCIHGSKDCWKNLKLICDVSEFICSHPHLNWESVLRRSEQMNCLRMLLLGLCLSQSILGAKIPAVVSQTIQDNAEIQALSTEFSENLFVSDLPLGRQFSVTKFFLHLKMTETFKDRIGCYLDILRPIQANFFFKLMPTLKDKEFLEIPQSLYFLYYFIRPIRLIWRQFAAVD